MTDTHTITLESLRDLHRTAVAQQADIERLQAESDALAAALDLDRDEDLRGFIVLHPKAFAALKRWGFLGKFGPIRKASGLRGRKRALMAAFRPTPQRVTMEKPR